MIFEVDAHITEFELNAESSKHYNLYINVQGLSHFMVFGFGSQMHDMLSGTMPQMCEVYEKFASNLDDLVWKELPEIRETFSIDTDLGDFGSCEPFKAFLSRVLYDSQLDQVIEMINRKFHIQFESKSDEYVCWGGWA